MNSIHEKRIRTLLATVFILALTVISAMGQATIGPSMVTIAGSQLLVQKRNLDGTLAPAVPYIMRGINWSPVSRDTNTNNNDPHNAEIRRAEFAKWYKQDIHLLKEMNVNTVRLYLDPGVDASGLAVLDELYRNGIMVIMTVDEAANNMERIESVIRFYQNHPAILLWLLGNEWEINKYYGKVSTAAEAAALTELAAQKIRQFDSAHPIATSYGDIDKGGLSEAQQSIAVCKTVDVWGLNIYRGNTFTNLFAQWKSLTNKPMFIGEFGTDAFRALPPAPLNDPVGSVDETMQAHWALSLWNDLFGNLSANDASKVALGGLAFEFNDEWIKCKNSGSQQTCGFPFYSHPDNFANEEFFGVVDIDRKPRAVFDTLKFAFDPSYRPTNSIQFHAVSRGGGAEEYPFQYGTAIFFKSGALLKRLNGGGGGGRGFNIATFHPTTGELLASIQNFDTYASRNTGEAMRAMIAFLNSLPNGSVILIAVADEAGLNLDSSCQLRNAAWVEDGLRTLEGLGSTQIRQYCFRDSWAMVTVKGEGLAREEQRGGAGFEASVATAIDLSGVIGKTVSVSGASYLSEAHIAVESIASAFGANLAISQKAATTSPLPTELLGTTVRVKDSAGQERYAPLFYVSPTQINYLLPPDTALGEATITIISGSGEVSVGKQSITSVAPGFFSAAANGKGLAAGFAIHVKPDGTQVRKRLADWNGAQPVPLPIDLGPENERVILELYGTGLRRNAAVKATIGGVEAVVEYAAAAPGFTGLDQVNLVLPRSLRGRGVAEIVLTVNGQQANPISVVIQ